MRSTVAAWCYLCPCWYRCQDGIVIGNDTTPVSIDDFYYLASVDDTVKDDFNRSFPGNAAFDEAQQDVQCWGNNSVFVHVIDSCPASQVSLTLPLRLLCCVSVCPLLPFSLVSVACHLVLCLPFMVIGCMVHCMLVNLSMLVA